MFVDTQVRPQGEQVDAVAPAKLKLSQAIRIGAKIRPQCTGKFFHDGGSCAMGAALEARGIQYRETLGFISGGQDIFPELFRDSRSFTELAKEIYIRNDGGWSRESIADWLAAQGL